MLNTGDGLKTLDAVAAGRRADRHHPARRCEAFRAAGLGA